VTSADWRRCGFSDERVGEAARSIRLTSEELCAGVCQAAGVAGPFPRQAAPELTVEPLDGRRLLDAQRQR
jgi:hypothetical protein